ncbi:hypothetical protein ACFL3V_06340 [Nanoarchaeota archaeon]
MSIDDKLKDAEDIVLNRQYRLYSQPISPPPGGFGGGGPGGGGFGGSGPLGPNAERYLADTSREFGVNSPAKSPSMEPLEPISSSVLDAVDAFDKDFGVNSPAISPIMPNPVINSMLDSIGNMGVNSPAITPDPYNYQSQIDRPMLNAIDNMAQRFSVQSPPVTPTLLTVDPVINAVDTFAQNMGVNSPAITPDPVYTPKVDHLTGVVERMSKQFGVNSPPVAPTMPEITPTHEPFKLDISLPMHRPEPVEPYRPALDPKVVSAVMKATEYLLPKPEPLPIVPEIKPTHEPFRLNISPPMHRPDPVEPYRPALDPKVVSSVIKATEYLRSRPEPLPIVPEIPKPAIDPDRFKPKSLDILSLIKPVTDYVLPDVDAVKPYVSLVTDTTLQAVHDAIKTQSKPAPPYITPIIPETKRPTFDPASFKPNIPPLEPKPGYTPEISAIKESMDNAMLSGMRETQSPLKLDLGPYEHEDLDKQLPGSMFLPENIEPVIGEMKRTFGIDDDMLSGGVRLKGMEDFNALGASYDPEEKRLDLSPTPPLTSPLGVLGDDTELPFQRHQRLMQENFVPHEFGHIKETQEYGTPKEHERYGLGFEPVEAAHEHFADRIAERLSRGFDATQNEILQHRYDSDPIVNDPVPEIKDSPGSMGELAYLKASARAFNIPEVEEKVDHNLSEGLLGVGASMNAVSGVMDAIGQVTEEVYEAGTRVPEMEKPLYLKTLEKIQRETLQLNRTVKSIFDKK